MNIGNAFEKLGNEAFYSARAFNSLARLAKRKRSNFKGRGPIRWKQWDRANVMLSTGDRGWRYI